MLWKKLVQFGKGFFERKEESTSTDMPLGTAMHNIEITRGRGGQLARAAGAVAKLIEKEGKSATLRLPSGEVRLVSQNWILLRIGPERRRKAEMPTDVCLFSNSPDPYPLSKKEECMNHGRGERTDHLPIFYKTMPERI